jgi:hypothetical protein
MSEIYIPREGSVVWKVIQFFQTNPDEQLDTDLISAKCDCDRRNVHTLLRPAVQAGLLKRAEDLESGELVYSIGTTQPPERASGGGFHAWLERKAKSTEKDRAPDAGTQSKGTPAKPTAQAAKRAGPFWIDVESLPIDKDVPMPPRRGTLIDWSPVLNRLEVGDSFGLPLAAKSVISKAITDFKKSTGKVLVSRRVDNGIRVWRTS